MGSFKEAIYAMEDGKTVVRPNWGKGNDVGYIMYLNKITTVLLKDGSIPKGGEGQIPLSITDYKAENWEIHEYKENSAEFLQRLGIDGSKWAKEFMKLFGEKKEEIDEGLMIGWLCNAIEAGRDNARWDKEKDIKEFYSTLSKKKFSNGCKCSNCEEFRGKEVVDWNDIEKLATTIFSSALCVNSAPGGEE